MLSMRRALILVLIFSFVFVSFSNDAQARRRRRHRPRRAKIINEKKLYERLGGQKSIGDIVDEWVRLNLADQRVNAAFSNFTIKPERLGKLRRNLGDQICEITDGPCQYKGSLTSRVRESVAMKDDQFLVMSDNLMRSMQKFNIPEREKNELLARLGDLRPDILGDSKPDSAAKPSP